MSTLRELRRRDRQYSCRRDNALKTNGALLNRYAVRDGPDDPKLRIGKGEYGACSRTTGQTYAGSANISSGVLITGEIPISKSRYSA
jgi:hypothetical protein